MRLTKIEDGDDGVVWASKPLNHGDFAFRYLLRLRYTVEWNRRWAESVGKYDVELFAVSPEAAGPDRLRDAAESQGLPLDELLARPDVHHCRVLLDYGTAARLGEWAGNNRRRLLREARRELDMADMLFGYYMDRPQNRIGDTGWDWIGGNVGVKLGRQSRSWPTSSELARRS